jgi:hypothetical protein
MLRALPSVLLLPFLHVSLLPLLLLPSVLLLPFLHVSLLLLLLLPSVLLLPWMLDVVGVVGKHFFWSYADFE